MFDLGRLTFILCHHDCVEFMDETSDVLLSRIITVIRVYLSWSVKLKGRIVVQDEFSPTLPLLLSRVKKIDVMLVVQFLALKSAIVG